MTEADPIQRALSLPNGARFYQCAVQVNPFEYLQEHSKPTSFTDENSYNQAIVQACLDQGIEVIAVTDHYRVSTAEKLWREAKDAGLCVFPGFESVTKDGVHVLCIFEQDLKRVQLERILVDCGIHDQESKSPSGKYDFLELLSECRKWGGLCIAAHVCSEGGLLKTLNKQARINAWISEDFLACSIPGPVNDAPVGLRPILQNQDPSYKRGHPVAILNAQDVSSPEDLAKPSTSCRIKMSEVSVEGLRQAFFDPESRVRLVSDPVPEEHAEFEAITWEGGFLDGAAVHFNENLNVLIGGRGTGKSTIVESLRYVLGLDPLGEEAAKAHEGIVQQVLRSGTKISLLVRSFRPEKRRYRIERTVPNPSVVRDESGAISNLSPWDIISRVEVYGQHEISDLTRNREKLTRLLERFVERDLDLDRRKNELRRELTRSRSRLLDARQEREAIEDQLSSLPAQEELLERYQSAGLEERLKEQSLLVREERVVKTMPGRLTPFREVLDWLQRELPIDRAFLSEKALEELPGKEILIRAEGVFKNLSRELETLAGKIELLLNQTDQEFSGIREQWEVRKKEVQERYEKILRELQKSKVDGEDFIQLRQQIEELRPLQEQVKNLRRDEKEHENHRRNLLAEWEDLKSEEFRRLDRAAKKVTRKLDHRVRVQVTFAGNRESLFALLRDEVGGRLKEATDALRRIDALSLKELADACRAGKEELVKKFGLSASQAERLVQAPASVSLQIEELDLPPMTQIELNTAPAGQTPTWQALENLSTGQKATAVLLLLLLESDSPLVVDQPEDDLDNRFITDGIVPRMREEKRRRQFVFSTHNANIPVLGDAELIVGLTAEGEPGDEGEGQAKIAPEHMGSIDASPVRELVEEILEGGKVAFETRRRKYGF